MIKDQFHPVNRKLVSSLHEFYMSGKIGLQPLAERLGMSAAYLCFLFKGQRGVGLLAAVRMAKVIDFDLNQLKELDDRETPAPRIIKKGPPPGVSKLRKRRSTHKRPEN